MSTVVRHYVDRTPDNRSDTSRVLCIRAGDCEARPDRPINPRRRHAWTLNPALVTCPRCKEWIHA